jgi:uncharacterized metal-binding protein YceD (DUF177 family)
MNQNEFPRPVDPARMGDGARQLEASPEERKALAKRFGIVSISRLEANLVLEAEAESTAINATGRLIADIIQSCAISGEDLPAHIDEPLAFRFVPEAARQPDEEVELSETDCDEIEYSGNQFDLGEAVAQSLALAIDPFATGPNADRVRKEKGLLDESSSGPFSALAALKKGLEE